MAQLKVEPELAQSVEIPVQSKLPAAPIQLKLVGLKPVDPPPLKPLPVRIFMAGYSSLKSAGLFIFLVIIPVAVSAVYLFFLSDDRFQSEARFVIRNSASAANASIGAVLGQGGISSSLDDAYAVNAYLVSNAALADLAKQMDIEAVLSRANNDLIWRYPSFFKEKSNEALLKQFQALIDVDLEKTGGITTLKAQAFTPEEAKLLASNLVQNAEQLVNAMGARSRQDAISMSTSQLNGAKNRVDAAQEKITQFRNRERVVDPTRISNAVVATIARLSMEIAETKAQFSQLKQVAQRSPQLDTLTKRIEALENQVIIERQQLAGSDSALAKKISEYETLVLEKQFAEKLLTAAANSVESARLDAQRQQVYVERIVAPALPDSPQAPKRELSLAIITAGSLLFFFAMRSLFRRRYEIR